MDIMNLQPDTLRNLESCLGKREAASDELDHPRQSTLDYGVFSQDKAAFIEIFDDTVTNKYEVVVHRGGKEEKFPAKYKHDVDFHISKNTVGMD
jgi:hypothetical protein